MDDASITMAFNYGAPMLEAENLDLLDQAHRCALEQAVRNILATDLAETAYAQILDGLPTEESLMDSYTFQEDDHPVFALNHVDICPGFVDKARQFRSEFDPSHLRYQPRVCSPRHHTLRPLPLIVYSPSLRFKSRHLARKSSIYG